jgi:hypothetical protein
VVKIAVLATVGAIAGIVAFWILTIPARVPAAALLTYSPMSRTEGEYLTSAAAHRATLPQVTIPAWSIARGSAAGSLLNRLSGPSTFRISRRIRLTASASGARQISSPPFGRERHRAARTCSRHRGDREEGHRDPDGSLGLLAQPRPDRDDRGGLRSGEQVTALHAL